MSTLVVVKKNGVASIAADTMTCFGSNKQQASYDAHPTKIQCVGDSYLGLVGSAAHNLVVESIFSRDKKVPRFQNRLEIFEFFRKLHPRLREEYFLNPKEEDDDPYESSQMDMFIANRYGIFGIYSLREVFEYKKFWALGSGGEYALGAMYAVYEHFDSAEAIARVGVEAGIEFDDGTGGPINSYCVDLTEKN
ncbi:MAG: MFS transporter [Candidatus Parabeggiatoa sp. nov. 2]|nr:MAG: MFS transporter [Beggiatoa sp. 4572_84]RKZ56119.1 MAG: MFS transporter [Gammaproteobacteria bacterium]